jgi:hypothetical protein
MARRTSKRTRRRTAPPEASQPMVPNVVTGALGVGSQVGRAALKTAQDALAAAARFVAGAAKTSEPKVTRPAGPPDSRLPEAALNAIVEARRRERAKAMGPRGSAKRKPPSGSSSRTESSAGRSRRRKRA